MNFYTSIDFQAKSKDEIEESLTCGLVKGHAYAVTAIQAVELNTATNGQIIRFVFLQKTEVFF